jgi:limonene-1,2-epoxide hydrolase
MATNDATIIATDMLKAWTSGDFARTRALLHDDATFDGPLGTTRGGDAYIEGIKGFAQTIDRAEVHKVIADGEDVCVVYDLVPKSAPSIPTVGIYRVEANKVRSVRAYFDPRPLLAK